MFKRYWTVMLIIFVILIGVVYANSSMAQDSELQAGLPGPYNAITDVPGIKVGHVTNEEEFTGTTVVMVENGAMGSVDVRGGWPGTINTDVLGTSKRAQLVNAVLLTGGSYYGLSSYMGVFDYFIEQGIPPGAIQNPLIAGAVIYDLGRGGTDPNYRPGPEYGYEAATIASTGPVDQGNVGAGIGATSGGIKGGVGTASIVLENGVIIGAICITNSVGRSFDPETGELWAVFLEKDNEFDILKGTPPVRFMGPKTGYDMDDLYIAPGEHTTIGVIATNATLTREEAAKVAEWAHNGLATAIRPAHHMFDGDSIFILATGEKEVNLTADRGAFQLAVQDTFSRAVVHGILNAESTYWIDSYRDVFPEMIAKEVPGVGPPQNRGSQ